jgi:hypothetical protein
MRRGRSAGEEEGGDTQPSSGRHFDKKGASKCVCVPTSDQVLRARVEVQLQRLHGDARDGGVGGAGQILADEGFAGGEVACWLVACMRVWMEKRWVLNA